MLNKLFKGNVPADPFGQAAMQTLTDDELDTLHALNRPGALADGALADAAAGNSDYLIPPHLMMSAGGAAVGATQSSDEENPVCEHVGCERTDTCVHAFGNIALCADHGRGQCIGTSEQENCPVCGGGAAQPDSDTTPAAGEFFVCASVSHVCF
jgi:hypothetical protein